MAFSSVIFLFVFFPAFFLVYYLCPERYRNWPALIGSLLFYAWGSPRFVGILLLSCGIDYLLAGRIAAARDHRHKRWYLATSIILSLGLLGYFKYANFFVAEFSHVLQWLGTGGVSITTILLPIGISFFTFHKISYVVDVYRKVSAPARSFWNYLLYILLFPQLIAGPILRYHDIAPQIQARTYEAREIWYGIQRFVLGLGKKVLIANALGAVADSVFGLPAHELSTPLAWLGILCYTFQIYFDFSGYSDMAIGIGRMLGFNFRENFQYPYIAQNITDFWRRWHISLSTFMREYVYIPLGGNRLGAARTYVNLWVVFFLSGLWHGASGTFIVWGAYHGFFMMMDKLFFIKKTSGWPRVLNTAITFLIVMIGWVFFRSNSLAEAGVYLAHLFGFTGQLSATPMIFADVINHRAWTMLVVALIISFVPLLPRFKELRDTWYKQISRPVGIIVSLLGLLVLYSWSVISLVGSQFNPFIYFRF